MDFLGLPAGLLAGVLAGGVVRILLSGDLPGGLLENPGGLPGPGP